jgi:hypothetical protein
MITGFQCKKKQAVLVLGMHRSGTSALTRAISLLGIDLPIYLMQASSENPTGYWESAELEKIHNGILASINSSWDDIFPIDASAFQTDEIASYRALLIQTIISNFSDSECFVLKDPRMCRLMPLWLEVLHELNVEIKVVIPFRHPLEVAMSLQERNGFLLEKSYLMWLRHVLEAERNTRGLTRCFVEYSQLLKNPQQVIDTVVKQCALTPITPSESEKQIRAFIDAQYYHQRLKQYAAMRQAMPLWVKNVYRILVKMSEHTDGQQIFHNKLDYFYARLTEADGLFVSLIKEKNIEIQKLTAKLEANSTENG